MRRFWITAIATFGLDQLTKLAVVQGLDLINRVEIDVLPPYLNFRMAWNYGVNFGLLSNGSYIARWGFMALAIAISAWVIGSSSAATARSTLATSLSAVVRISSRKIDSLVEKWK